MKRKLLKATIAMLLAAVCALAAWPVTAHADGSHGFYMDCDASVVNNKANGFMLDFYSDSAEALCTYWANANWSMYTADTAKRLGCRSLTGGGAYAGLQILDHKSVRKGIMSLWRYEYKDSSGKTNYIYAKALYGKTTTYDNEGSGTSCVMDFDWSSSTWYRQLLYCWRDIETGYTFIGTWFYDYATEQWTLFAYYNTFLWNSYITGDVGQFLENFSESKGALYRSFQYRNVYFLSTENQWKSSPTVSIKSDGNPKAFGEAKLGVSEDGTYVWASVDGKSEIDTDHRIELQPTLRQDDQPSYGKPKIETVSLEDGTVRWEMDAHSTPQLSYTVRLLDKNGNQLVKRMGTRPEVRTADVTGATKGAVKCEVSVTDVFGQSTLMTYDIEEDKTETPSEGSAGDGSAEKPTVTPPETNPPSDDAPVATEEKDNGMLIGILCGVGGTLVCVALVTGICVAYVKKKKRK